MRKLLFIAGLSLTVSASFAQKIDDVKKDVTAGKYADARSKIDQVLADSKNASNGEVQFYKAVVYHNLAKQSPDSATSAAALEAMKAYVQAEESKPEAQRMLLSTLENHKTLIDIYQSYFNRGIENFKGNTYVTAFHNFEKALDVFDILSKKNLTNAKFDTTVTLYAGYSAQNARMFDQATKYYDRIVNLNVPDTNYVGIYRFMINTNLDKKDTTSAKRYLALSQKSFPQYNDVWLDYQTLFLSNDKTKRFDEYEALVKANPKNETLALNYAIELYNQLRSSEDSEKDPAVRQRAEAAFKNILSLNPNNATANLLISQFYWTELYQIQNAISDVKGATAAATAKKKELNGQMDAVFEKVFPYLTKSYDLYNNHTDLKAQEKANYRIVLGQLMDYYNRKKQTAKVAELQKLRDTLK